MTWRCKLRLVWLILRVRKPRWYRGDGGTYGKVRYFHIVPSVFVVRVPEEWVK